MARDMCHGNPSESAAARTPHASGVCFVDTPCKSDTVTAAKQLHVNSCLLEKHTAILLTLKKKQRDSSFSRSNVETALQQILVSETWNPSSEKKQSAVQVMTRRLRNTCTVVSQAEAKEKPPKWINMPWIESTGNAAADSNVHLGPLEIEYGFCSEVNLAWKRVAGMNRKHISMPMAFDPNEDPAAPVAAQWIDGDTQAVARSHHGPTCAELHTKWRCKRRTTAAKDTKPCLTIIQKVDRRLLLVLCEQSTQALQVNVRDFGSVENERAQLPRGHAALTAGVALVQTTGTEYADGKLERTELRRQSSHNVPTRATATCQQHMTNCNTNRLIMRASQPVFLQCWTLLTPWKRL